MGTTHKKITRKVSEVNTEFKRTVKIRVLEHSKICHLHPLLTNQLKQPAEAPAASRANSKISRSPTTKRTRNELRRRNSDERLARKRRRSQHNVENKRNKIKNRLLLLHKRLNSKNVMLLLPKRLSDKWNSKEQQRKKKE